MKIGQMLLLMGYSLGLAIGQLLFKKAAVDIQAKLNSSRSLLTAAGTNVPLWSAIILYAGLTGLWVYILTQLPLSRAYPAIALTFVLTPLLGSKLFGETLSLRFFCGLAIVVVGLALIVTEDTSR